MLQVQESTAPLIEASSPANNCSSYRGFKSRKQLLLLSWLQVLEASIREAVDSWT
jgi:NAD(P)H-flavin reductase